VTARSTPLRAVAAFEAAKGVLVLVAAGVLGHLLNSASQGVAEELARHFQENPARHHPQVLLQTLLDFGNAHRIALSIGALFYAGIRFLEAYGLWHGRNWAWGFGIMSAALYLPFEIAELARHVSWAGLLVFCVNVAIIVVLWRNRKGAA
jgi:uncharacterized membrane protein (DUF2068 family)